MRLHARIVAILRLMLEGRAVCLVSPTEVRVPGARCAGKLPFLAMKAREEHRVSTLRLVNAALKNADLEAR